MKMKRKQIKSPRRRLTWRTSWSIPSPAPCISPCRSCTAWGRRREGNITLSNVENVMSSGLALPGNLRNKRIIRIRITQKRTDWEENFGHGQCWRPLRSEQHHKNNKTLTDTFPAPIRRTGFLPEDIQANGPVGVDVGMVNLRREGDFGWLEGVVSGEVDGEEEDPALVRTVRWSHDGGLQHRLVTSHVVTLVTWQIKQFKLNQWQGWYQLPSRIDWDW